jgi:hypothetical protein
MSSWVRALSLFLCSALLVRATRCVPLIPYVGASGGPGCKRCAWSRMTVPLSLRVKIRSIHQEDTSKFKPLSFFTITCAATAASRDPGASCPGNEASLLFFGLKKGHEDPFDSDDFASVISGPQKILDLPYKSLVSIAVQSNDQIALGLASSKDQPTLVRSTVLVRYLPECRRSMWR